MDEKDRKISLLLEDLASLEDYIHDLFVFSPLPICFISPMGVVLEANPAFEKISNFVPGELVGESIEKLFRAEEIKQLTKDTLKKGYIKGKETIFFPKEKKEIIVQVFTRARRDEKRRAIGCFLGLFNLTKVKETERELRSAQSALLNILEDTEEARQKAEAEKNKTRAIIVSFVDGLLAFNKENRVVLINPQAENFLKVRQKEILGKSIKELARIKNFKGLRAILGEEIQEVSRKEWEARENFFLQVSAISLKTEGEKTGNLVILHDVSREKIIERLKTEFVSITAHQLRTPLSAIKWTLRMLIDGDLGEITPEQEDYLEKTYKANERMISLINSLLNVTRIEEGRFIYKPTFAKIEEVAEGVVESLKAEAERKNIKLQWTKAAGLPKILIDVEKLKLAIQNLIDNAIKYTLPGGRVIVSLKKNNKDIEFLVRDTGVGISELQKERVFTKFFRGANVMRMETEGSGLGLFITKNIIEAHGGKIWFKSREGRGASFYFTLPIKREFEAFLEKF